MAQTFVNGLLLGSDYALLAIGYTLVFGVTRLLTLAHGQIFMLSAVAALLAMSHWGISFPLAVGVGLVVGIAAGVATDVVCFRPIAGTAPFSAAVATIGFGLIIQNGVVALHGSDPIALPSDVGVTDFHVGPFLISGAQLGMLILAFVLMLFIQWFVRRTVWGAALRGMAESHSSIQLCGVNPKTLSTLVLAASGALAAAASALVALRIGSVSPFSGLEVGLIGLAIMTIAGMGSVTGAMLAGLAVGMAQVYAEYYGFGGFEPAIPWILVVIVLLVRPEGLFGRSVR